MNVSVVVPCYRSTATLPTLVERLHAALGAAGNGVEGYEIVLVVDGSPDGTPALARTIARDDPRVRAVVLRRNYGQHNALIAGIAVARHDVVVTMDDDLQHRPECLPDLVAPLRDPAVDLVYGVPEAEEHGPVRSLASRSVKLCLAAAGVPGARDISALRAFRRELRDGFPDVRDAFVSLDVLLSWTTTSVERVRVTMDHRVHGASAYSVPALVRHAWNMATGYGTLPLRVVSWVGTALGSLGIALLAVVLWKFFSGTTTVSGFTTVASMVAMFSGAQLLSVGVLGQYVGRLHFRSMQRPTYLVRDDSGTVAPGGVIDLGDAERGTHGPAGLVTR